MFFTADIEALMMRLMLFSGLKFWDLSISK